MSAELFTDAMSQISDKYITEALNYHCAAKRRPVIRWFGRSVAAACLALVLCFGTVMAVSAEARAAVFGWVRQQYENFYEYFFEGDAAVTSPAEYELGWVPEGVTLVDNIEMTGGEIYIYTDDKDTLIRFSYNYGPDSGNMAIDRVGNETVEVTVHGGPGEISITPSEDETDHIVWTDEIKNTLFVISGHFDEATLLRMAESVKEKNE